MLYALAYFFEIGYLFSFGLTEDFITVSIERFFVALFVTFTFLFPAIVLFELFYTQFKHLWVAFLPLIITMMCLSLSYILYDEDPKFSIIASWGSLGFSVFFYLGVWIFKGKMSYSKAIEDYVEFVTVRANSKTFDKLIHSVLFGKVIILFFTGTLIMVSLISVGKLSGKTQEKFLVTLKKNEPYALLRVYGDLNIFVNVNRTWTDLYNSKNTLGKKYLVIKADESIYERWKIEH